MTRKSQLNGAIFALGLSLSCSRGLALPESSNLEEATELHAAAQHIEFANPADHLPLYDLPRITPPPQAKSGPLKKVVSGATSLANFVFDLRGFDWSKEGANAILEEKLKPNSEPAREFLSRKSQDEKELALVAATLQLASVTEKDELKTKLAINRLVELIGEEPAARLNERLKLYSTVSSALLQSDKASEDVDQKCNRLKIVLESASQNDPIVQTMTARLHKFNHRSKFLEVTAKVVYATMGVASFAPTLVAPIAETTLLTFMMGTGGPEQDKLLKEVYLGKCLQSRANLINEKAHLVLDTYDLAILTKNPRLLACAREQLRHMTDENAFATFLGNSANQSELTSKIDMNLLPNAASTQSVTCLTAGPNSASQ
jgi:hypothetical protein